MFSGFYKEYCGLQMVAIRVLRRLRLRLWHTMCLTIRPLSIMFA
jgi:hypothetical protein